MSPDLVGMTLPEFEFGVDRSQLRLFCKAIGETRPVHNDPAAARAAGYRDLPAPPTFPFSICFNPDDPFDSFGHLGVSLSNVLHGEQRFEYFEPICAGDVVKVKRTVTGYEQKKGGALHFITVSADLVNADKGRLQCRAHQTLVVVEERPND